MINLIYAYYNIIFLEEIVSWNPLFYKACTLKSF